MYRFPKREACLMAMSYSYELQAKVFDHMTELEEAVRQLPAPVVPQTMAQALRLAADQAEQIEEQQRQLELAAPKVEFVDRYVEAETGSVGIEEGQSNGQINLTGLSNAPSNATRSLRDFECFNDVVRGSKAMVEETSRRLGM